MSVIVKGMEMPESCAKCKLKYWTNANPYCPVIQSNLEWNQYSNREWTGIDTRCPLVELPEKHGRLGDLDELQALFRECIDECKKWIQEAEDGGDVETILIARQSFNTFVEANLKTRKIPTIVEAEGD